MNVGDQVVIRVSDKRAEQYRTRPQQGVHIGHGLVLHRRAGVLAGHWVVSDADTGRLIGRGFTRRTAVCFAWSRIRAAMRELDVAGIDDMLERSRRVCREHHTDNLGGRIAF